MGLEGEHGAVVATQKDSLGMDQPVLITGKLMTKTEMKGTELEQLVILVAWCVRKHRVYFQHAPKVEVCLPWPEQARALKDDQMHVRVKALLLDL